MLMIQAQAQPSPIHGLGCFTLQNIPEGAVVWEFHHEVDRAYSVEEFWRLPPTVRKHFCTYAWVNPSDGRVLFSGDLSQFFNHSPQANTRMSADGYRCVAVRAIAAGEELTSDYEQLLDVPGLLSSRNL
jgi:SET domain-containing protein